MQTELSALRQAAIDAVRRTPAGKQVADIVLEAGRDNEGSEFLRVLVQVKTLDKAKEAEIEELMNSIEGAVSALDERFPSVRFADAA